MAYIEKLLEAQIEQLKLERNKLEKGRKTLTRLGKANEDKQRRLEKAMDDLRQSEERAVTELNVWRDTERAKIAKEAKQRERNAKKLQTLPTKKERQQIEELKK
jgi:hypothetical protein